MDSYMLIAWTTHELRKVCFQRTPRLLRAVIFVVKATVVYILQAF